MSMLGIFICDVRTKIYSHVTIATDPDNVSFVFAAVKHTILSGIVEELFRKGPVCFCQYTYFILFRCDRISRLYIVIMNT